MSSIDVPGALRRVRDEVDLQPMRFARRRVECRCARVSNGCSKMIESAAMPSSKSVPKDVVARFAGIEIGRFTTRVEKARQGLRGYHLKDCQKYLGIWKSIQSKDYDWEKLTEEERAEVIDALDDDEHG